MIRVSCSLFHDMIGLRMGEKQISLQVAWRQKIIPIGEKSTVKWKSEKEIVDVYSVTGSLEKMY